MGIDEQYDAWCEEQKAIEARGQQGLLLLRRLGIPENGPFDVTAPGHTKWGKQLAEQGLYGYHLAAQKIAEALAKSEEV